MTRHPSDALHSHADAIAAGADTSGTPSGGNAAESISEPSTEHEPGERVLDGVRCLRCGFRIFRRTVNSGEWGHYSAVADDRISFICPAAFPPAVPLHPAPRKFPREALRGLRASFIYDPGMGCHIGACSGFKWNNGKPVQCGNGPLDDSQLEGGICDEGPHVTIYDNSCVT